VSKINVAGSLFLFLPVVGSEYGLDPLGSTGEIADIFSFPTLYLSPLFLDVVVFFPVLFDALLDVFDGIVLHLFPVGLQSLLLAVLVRSDGFASVVEVGLVLAFEVALWLDLLQLIL
jgi:hypothetical protein